MKLNKYGLGFIFVYLLLVFGLLTSLIGVVVAFREVLNSSGVDQTLTIVQLILFGFLLFISPLGLIYFSWQLKIKGINSVFDPKKQKTRNKNRVKDF